ncbi:DctP family TRAP transporter solute-binding subunit [Arhodomonas sp. SL1]|uniref:DctP family TRAP transporter solute-binding subunit n=1 Tax=Arhodomonas sp. SL1 TaxID=3425691 RepID=UPI003F881091
MRKSVVSAIACVAVFGLSAGATAAEYKDEYTVSTVLPTPFPWGQAAERWVELVDERTDGRVNLKVYSGAQLVSGNQTQEFSALRSGLIDFAVGSTINWSPQVQELNLFSLPFLMPDYAAIDALTGGEVGDRIFAAIERQGVVPLAWGENGFRELTNSVRPVRTPGDVEGMKIRVVGSPLFQDTFEALGANPTQMSWADAKPALSTGAVDGQENPLSVIQIAKMWEVGQEYVTRWHYMADPLIFAANRDTWESLPEADREIIHEAAREAGRWEIEKSRAEVEDRIATLESEGMEIIELSDSERAAFREATASVYDEWAPRIGEDLVEQAREAVAERER